MVGIIFGSTLNRANTQMNKLIQDYELMGYKKISHCKDEVRFNNGDIWYILLSNTSVRGCACNIAYIDHFASEKSINEILMPMIKGIPYCGYNYF